MCEVTFIIPTYNEECFLPQTLECISAYMPKSLTYEIVVADNGSSDQTVEIAKQYAKVLVDEKTTVGGLRNLAVTASKGAVLVFIDADVLLTPEWMNNFLLTYESLLLNPYQITGSRCSVANPASWIESVWFAPLVSLPSKYINSGHLITTKELFEQVGGFDADLETGEDYAFCQSAINKKAVICNNPSLVVIHKGYPKTVYQFLRREMWHGKGDCESTKSILSSRVASVSIFFVILHVIALLGFILHSGVTLVVALLLILSISVFSSIYKHRANSIKDVILISFLYYLYFGSRFFSGISGMSNRCVKREEGC